MARWNVIKAFSLGACGVFACSGAPNLDLGTTQAPIVLPVGSDEGSLWVKTIPTASCVLASSEPTSDSASLRFATDEEGIAEIGSLARPTSATEFRERLNITCTAADGRTFEHSFVLGSDPNGRNSDGVISTVEIPRRHNEVRPALEGNPDSFSQATLIARGYPLRPDRAKNPNAYARWLSIVSSPARVASSSSLVGMSDVTNASSAQWSGYEIVQSGVTYDFVEGLWTVPTIPFSPPTNDSHFAASVWVGVGGDVRRGSNTLVQDGILGELTKICSWCGYVRSYSAWIEYLPWTAVTESSVPVHAGDTFFAQAWLGDASGNVNPSGQYGWFFLQNITAGVAWRGNFQNPNGAPFVGSSAEWIIERPNFGDVGNQPPLANYQHATMTDMFAYVSTNTVTPHDLATDPNVNITLDDLNLNYALSTVAQTGDYSEAFTWVKAK